MPLIDLTFSNNITLHLNVSGTSIGNDYFNLVKQEYSKSFPSYRDRIKYTPHYLQQLAKQAKVAFGWEWDKDYYDLTIAPTLHKDLEILLGKTGFTNVPAEFDLLLSELHYCLHIVQTSYGINTRIGNLQVEWFSNSGFALDNKFVFHSELNFGDCVLQNPYVGHGPVQIFQEQDWENLTQTCKFHNFVKPGIVVFTGKQFSINKDNILNSFKQHDPEFVKSKTEEQILKYTGFPIIAKVLNLNDLTKLVNDPAVISLSNIKFTNE